MMDVKYCYLIMWVIIEKLTHVWVISVTRKIESHHQHFLLSNQFMAQPNKTIQETTPPTSGVIPLTTLQQSISDEIAKCKKTGTYINTSAILEQSKQLSNASMNEYYTNVLAFLNILFESNGKCISKIWIKKLNFTKDTVLFYNSMIKKHNMEFQEFDVEKYDFNPENQDASIVIEIVTKIVNNLLQKLDFKFIITKKKDGTMMPRIIATS